MEQTLIHKTLHRKLKIEKHDPTKTGGSTRFAFLFKVKSKLIARVTI